VTLTEDNDPQLMQLMEHLRKEIRSSTPLVQLGRLMMRMGKWQKAEFFFQTAFNNENDWQRRASTLANLGTVYYEQDMFDKSLDYFLRALRQFREYVADDDPCLHPIYNNIGNVYHKQNKLDISFQYLEHSLNIAKVTIGIDPDILATYCNNIAGVLLKQGKIEDALSYQTCANDILAQMLPQNHPNLAIFYHNTAESLFQSNRITEAIEYQQKAVDIALQSLPIEHPQVQWYRATLTFFRCVAGDKTVIWESADSDESDEF
jgi:tetratricopeptide (TPR) repeat protein